MVWLTRADTSSQVIYWKSLLFEPQFDRTHASVALHSFGNGKKVLFYSSITMIIKNYVLVLMSHIILFCFISTYYYLYSNEQFRNADKWLWIIMMTLELWLVGRWVIPALFFDWCAILMFKNIDMITNRCTHCMVEAIFIYCRIRRDNIQNIYIRIGFQGWINRASNVFPNVLKSRE